MKRFVLFIPLLFLVGCATGYQSSGFTGGYQDMKLQDDVYKVSFKGNAYISSDRAQDFALLRSAEITLENGYNYFVVLNEGTTVAHSSYTTPVTANTTGQVYGYGNYANYSGTTTYSGGQTYHYNKPSTQMTIKCFKEKPENINALVYDAEQIKENLRKTYKLNNKQ